MEGADLVGVERDELVGLVAVVGTVGDDAGRREGRGEKDEQRRGGRRCRRGHRSRRGGGGGARVDEERERAREGLGVVGCTRGDLSRSGRFACSLIERDRDETRRGGGEIWRGWWRFQGWVGGRKVEAYCGPNIVVLV